MRGEMFHTTLHPAEQHKHSARATPVWNKWIASVEHMECKCGRNDRISILSSKISEHENNEGNIIKQTIFRYFCQSNHWIKALWTSL